MKMMGMLSQVLGLVFIVSGGVQAQSIYAASKIALQGLFVNIEGITFPAANAWIFDVKNTAALVPGGSAFTTNTCTGGPGVGPCTPVNPLSPVAIANGDVLDAGPAQVGISLPPQSFDFVGPNSGQQYARSDSVINDASLSGDPTTAATDIAETELVDGAAGSGASNVQSNTGFIFQFSADGPGSFTIGFSADPALMALIDDPTAAAANASASHTFQVKLIQDTGTGAGDSATWSPSNTNTIPNPCSDGDVVFTGSGITCGTFGELSPEDLNNDVAVSTTPLSQDVESFPGDPTDQGFQYYQLVLAFANAGTYTFSMSESKNVLVTRQAAPTVFYDLGDNPDPPDNPNPPYNYHTRLANNGPRHLAVNTIYMGQCVDGEADGQPSIGAYLDDATSSADVHGTCQGGDDEDGVINPALLLRWQNNETRNIGLAVLNFTGSDAKLYGWIDFSGNGEFEPGERQEADVPSGFVGNRTLTFTAPADAVAATRGSTYARFRLSTDPAFVVAASPVGYADDGEVEDYPVTLGISDIPLMGPWGLLLLILLLPAVAVWKSRRMD